MVVDLLGRTRLLDAAFVHDHDAIRDLKRLLLIVGNKDRGDVDLGVEVAQPPAQFLAHFGIERAERLVEQENTRLNRERTRKRDTLPLPAREVGRVSPGEPAQLHKIQQLFDAPADLRFIQPMSAGSRAQAEGDVLEYSHMPEQRIMLEDKADMALADGTGECILPVKSHLAVVRPFEPRDDAQQGRLA